MPGAVRERMAARVEWEVIKERVDSGVHLGRCQPEGSPEVELKAIVLLIMFIMFPGR